METPPTADLPNRRRPAHQPVFEQQNHSSIIFVTVCTENRRPILANPEVQQHLAAAWTKATHWLVGRYVIMPDHVHFFCAPGTMPPEPLRSWVSFWKRLVTQSYGSPLWQKNFWDTQLRAHESYAAKWNYVRENPVRAGLVPKPEDWPSKENCIRCAGTSNGSRGREPSTSAPKFWRARVPAGRCG